jgi:GNAT superfamily N-acetyltransferase
VKFLAVHPRSQLRGLGTQMLGHLESFCRDNGALTVDIGDSAPFYVSPGVDVRITDAICFLQERGYRRIGDAVNQSVRLSYLPEPILETHLATPDDYQRISPWLTEHHPNWIAEVTRAIELETCVVHGDLGFACYDVNRDGWFGPMATRPDVGTKGVGTATLLGALHRMRAAGYEQADIAWSGPLLFYLKTVGARINRVFWRFRKDLT